MPNPAFIVDGHTEQSFVSGVCPGHPVRRTNLNGKSVTISAIAKKVASIIRLLGNRHYPIIVLVDRETREQSCQELVELLNSELENEGLEDQDIRIGFPDRMIENWIIADFKLIGSDDHKPEQTDGLNGASFIKKLKGSYSKVIDGVKYLHSIDREIVYQESPSFRNFIDSLEDLDCEYLNFDKNI